MTKTKNVIYLSIDFLIEPQKRQLNFVIKTSKKLRMMYKFSLILFSNLLQLSYVCSVVTNNSDKYLPLTMIKHQGQLEYPNKIENATIHELLGFTGDTQFSKDDSKDQMFFCPVDSTKQLDQIEEANKLMRNASWFGVFYSNSKVSEHCLFRRYFETEDALRCADDATPTIYRIRTGRPGAELPQICGPKDDGALLYKFVYEICAPISLFERMKGFIPLISQSEFEKYNSKMPFQHEHLIVYEICYVRNIWNAIYTKHKLKSANLLFDERLEHEKKKQYSMMTNNYGIFELDFELAKGFYDLLKNSAGQSEPPNEEIYEEKIPDYIAEKLVPSDDMMTAVLKKPTFHYINVKPMHRGLVEFWNYLGDLVRKNFKNQKIDTEIEIYTGAFILNDSEYQVPDNFPPHVPHIWIKIIHEKTTDPDGSSTIAIIMKNEYQLGGNSPDNGLDWALKKLCRDDYCRYFKQNWVEFNRFSHLFENVRCCPFNDEINSFFNIKINGDTLLPIADLTYDNLPSHRIKITNLHST